MELTFELSSQLYVVVEGGRRAQSDRTWALQLTAQQALPLTDLMVLSKLLSLSELQLPHLQKGVDRGTHLIGWLL